MPKSSARDRIPIEVRKEPLVTTSENRAAVRSVDDFPELSDLVIRRPPIPGSGQKPEELQKLIEANYLYLHARNPQVPRLHLEPMDTEHELSAWRLPLGDLLEEGLPVEAAEQINPEDISDNSADGGWGQSFRPDWIDLAFQPRPAIPRSRSFLRRRNGQLVVADLIYGGKDDRQVFSPDLWPWNLAGRIDVWCKYPEMSDSLYLWSGTGALVGDNVVLTASHVVPWFALALGFKWSMKLIPACYDGESRFGKGVYSYVAKVWGYSDHSQGDDMAVLKLKVPLGKSLGFFGCKTYSDDWEGGAYWNLMGYPDAVGGGNRPTWQSGIRILDDDSDGAGVELEHTGDTTAGNSGGPLWAWWGDSPYIIGTHSGTEHNWDEDNSVAAGGSALAKLMQVG